MINIVYRKHKKLKKTKSFFISVAWNYYGDMVKLLSGNKLLRSLDKGDLLS